jgi:hypothetical protein
MGEENKELKLVFVVGYYPPFSGGTGVIIKNLISGLPKGIVVGIATNDFKGLPDFEVDFDIPICKLFKLHKFLSHRGEKFIRKILFYNELIKLKRFVKKIDATYVIGVYPDYEFLSLANKCADSLKLNFVPYLHDTIAEGLSHTAYKNLAKKLQKNIFENKGKLLVMSDGMKELYEKKYGIKSTPIRHSYPEFHESSKFETHNIENKIFWGGEIYSINKNSFNRINNARLGCSLEMEIASRITESNLKILGISTEKLEINLYSRKAYINGLRKKGFLLLALDWPDESVVHQDELATIFPTKTVEYLAAGRPIIVHCPQN